VENNNMKKHGQKLKLSAALLIAAFSTGLQAEPLVTLKEMVDKIISANPEVQARYHEYIGSGYERDAARGNYLPKADIVSTYRNQEDFPNSNLSRASGTAIPKFNNEFVIRQMLFDGFATPSEVARLNHAQRVRYYELQNTMQETTLEFMRSYEDTLRYRELLDYAKTNFVIHKQYFEKIKERVDAGVARKVDLEQATGRLALAEANLLTETNNLYDVSVRIQRLLGEIPPATLEKPTFVSGDVDASASEALQYAYANNPAILSTIEDIEATHKEIKTKESKYLPRFDLEARKNLGTTNDGRYSTSAADVLQLTMNYNIFNGFSDKAVVSQTVEKLNRSKDLRDKACIDTRQLVSIAYNDINQLKQQLEYRKQHRASIEAARDAYQKQFDIGQRTLLDLLDSENELFQAKRNFANAEYDLQTAYIRLFAAQGQLVQKVGSVRQDLPTVNKEAYEDAVAMCAATAPEQVTVDKAALLADAKPLNQTRLITPVAAPEPAKEKIVLSDKVIPDVQFETNSAKIKPASYPVLDNAIKTLKEWGESGVEVGGHTDKRNTSSEAYNLNLSDKRANSVMQYLIKHGIEAKRLSAKGYGFSVPIAENDPVSGSSVNRRVELVRQKD
jgi:outer membrane protein, adhesin transport system